MWSRRFAVRPRGTHRMLGLVSVALLALVSCEAAESAPPRERVRVIEVGHPVSEPKYSEGAVYGLVRETRQVARIPFDGNAPTGVRLSAPLEELGKNLATTRESRHAVFVPQPRLNRVVELDPVTLTPRATFPAGPSPHYLAVDVGSRMLLALSADGTTVTGVDVRGLTARPPREVGAGPEAELDGPARGRLVDFFVAGPGGISHFKGQPDEIEKKGEIGVRAHKTAGDEAKTSRIYVAEEGTNRLLAVDTKPGGGLAISASAHLGEPVRHVGADEVRVFAATEHRLFVFESDSYEGFDNGEFALVDTIDFRAAVPESLKNAELGGLAVGEDEVYLSFKSEPYLLSIAIPGI